MKPHDFVPFIGEVGDSSTEGFRALYKINVDGDEMLCFVTKVTYDGEFAIVEMIQKI